MKNQHKDLGPLFGQEIEMYEAPRRFAEVVPIAIVIALIAGFVFFHFTFMKWVDCNIDATSYEHCIKN